MPQQAPAWLRNAVQRGDAIYELSFKPGFETALAHVVDWLRADPDAARTVRTVPEADFLGLLTRAADAYFAKQSDGAAKQAQQSLQEPGVEVIMTFRQHKNSPMVMAQESDLASNANGSVVSFWVKLISAEALNREGKLMHHCVGSYADLVKSESVVIYSLRDMKNEPHATVELAMRGGPPTINQVKGKNNQAPLGRYAVYIKDFLNALGVRASETGAKDVQGLGLLAHGGKFGTILEVGGTILAGFANGDSIRTLADEAPRMTRYGRNDRWQTYMYVEKDGTVPFSFTLTIASEADPAAIEGKTVNNFQMVRKEVSRFPTYAKSMIEFLNQKRLKGQTKTFEQLGVFYDARKPVWGTRADLTEQLFTYKGISVSRIVEDVFFADAKNVVFATAYLLRNQLSRLKVINECEATSLIPELILEFGNRVIKDQMHDKAARDYIADYGAFWNAAKGKYVGVPENRSTLFKSQAGHVCNYMNRLFFYDPSQRLIASYKSGKEEVPYKIGETDLVIFTIAGADRLDDRAVPPSLLKLLADMSAETPPLVVMGYFDARRLREVGYYIENHKLFLVADVEADKKLGGSFTAATRITDGGGRMIALMRGKQELAKVYLNGKGVAHRIEFDIQRGDDPQGVSPAVMTATAAMLNAAKVVMPRIKIFTNRLQIKNGKYAALDAAKNKSMIDFLRGKVDLGGGFRFTVSTYLDRLDDANARRLGYIDYNYHTICHIDWADSSKTDLTYRMPRDLPEGVTRTVVIKVTAKFMHFYHDQIEQYMSTDLWSPVGA